MRGIVPDAPLNVSPGSSPAADASATPSEPLESSTDPTFAARTKKETPLQNFDAFVPAATLFAGDKGDAVQQLQGVLVNVGALSPDDAKAEASVLGAKTVDALHGFQAQNGIQANLLYGPQTRSGLETALNAKAYPDLPANDLASGASGEDVTRLQQALVKVGGMSPDAASTEAGKFGSQTEAALRALQGRYGLMESGIFSGSARYTLEQLVGLADGKNKALELPEPGLLKDSQGKPFELYSYSGPLGDPSPTGVVQGGAGDCYFDSALGSIANVNPDAVRKLVKDNGDGTYTFTFKTYNAYRRAYDDTPITVDSNLYGAGEKTKAGATLLSPLYDGDAAAIQGSPNAKMSSLRVPLFEKAFAQFEGGSYERIGTGGWPVLVMESLLGRQAYSTMLSAMTPDQVWDVIQKGVASKTPMTLGSSSKTNPDMDAAQVVEGHAYMLLNAKEENGQRMVEVRNPWGVKSNTDDKQEDASFWLPLSTVLKCYEGLDACPPDGVDIGLNTNNSWDP